MYSLTFAELKTLLLPSLVSSLFDPNPEVDQVHDLDADDAIAPDASSIPFDDEADESFQSIGHNNLSLIPSVVLIL